MKAIKRFKEILRVEQERNLVLKEMQDIIGFDISFSNEIVMKNAMDVFDREFSKELSTWMKSHL